MKKGVRMFIPLALAMLTARGLAGPALPEPGPEAAGLRLRLVVAPHPEGGKQGYDVQVDLISVSREAILLRASHWRSARHEGGFREYLEAAVSIESYPAIEPWLGQVMEPLQGTTGEPEYALKPSATLSLNWQTTGRHLKNSVSNPLEVQNPEFAQDGLYSVHVSIVLLAGDGSVRLRSNEQLVPMGGSREAPKHTYGPLRWVDENSKTARLGLGSLDKIVPGDRFCIQSGIIGKTWTLTIKSVDANDSTGTLEPSQVNPAPAFPLRGAYAAIIPTK